MFGYQRAQRPVHNFLRKGHALERSIWTIKMKLWAFFFSRAIIVVVVSIFVQWWENRKSMKMRKNKNITILQRMNRHCITGIFLLFKAHGNHCNTGCRLHVIINWCLHFLVCANAKEINSTMKTNRFYFVPFFIFTLFFILKTFLLLFSKIHQFFLSYFS